MLRAEARGEVLAVEDLGLRYSELACCTTAASGALLLPLATDTDDAILWFRPELSRTITWGGNPSEHGAVDLNGTISPRTSFAAWKETVHGRSVPWSEASLAIARALRSAVAAAAAERTKAEMALLRYYDPLTGLPNRSLLLDRLADSQQTPGAAAALLFLDLDRFKAVNDTMGHAAGDALLVEVARRLLAAVGPQNLVARLGGDEFVVLCRGLDRDVLDDLGEQVVRQTIEAPFEILGRSCNISVSIGIAVAGQSGRLDLIQAADMAMYAAKQRGGNRGMMFQQSLFDRAAARFELDQDLREALRGDDQFVLQYQPLFKITGAAKKLVGFEALVRWRHPRSGWMAPGLFIPQAEKSGLILPLGGWVLTKALSEGQEFFRIRPDTKGYITVNVSVVQFAEPGFCRKLAAMLQAEGCSPGLLCLEVTESMLADGAISSVIADIRGLGVRVAIDDFGTGYSSLSSLRHLPADIIKLDRSFIEGDAGDPVFIGSVIELAHAAGMSVVQEGIETQAQLKNALAAGVDMYRATC